jgi:molecular chaperone GrpE
MNRDDLKRRFEQWLDTALAAEDPANTQLQRDLATSYERQGYARLQAGDSYTPGRDDRADGEVKLQGGRSKSCTTRWHADDGWRKRGAATASWREVQREAERRSRRDVLAALIDVRDRLWRGVESARAVERETSSSTGRRWWTRAFATAGEDPSAGKLAALKKGYELGLERLDQTLAELNAHEIRCEGQLFDPRRMNAVDKEESTLVPEGTVLEVYRSGYEWSGEVFRPAQVKVSYRTHE